METKPNSVFNSSLANLTTFYILSSIALLLFSSCAAEMDKEDLTSKIEAFVKEYPVSDSKPLDCETCKEGIFLVETKEDKVQTIIRDGLKQEEYHSNTGITYEFDVYWYSERAFVLNNRRVTTGENNSLISADPGLIFCNIEKVKGDTVTISQYSEAEKSFATVKHVIIDSSKTYSHIRTLPTFEDYTATPKGGRLLNHKVSLSYGAHPMDRQKFFLALELTVVSTKTFTRSVLLDSLFYSLEDGQKLATENIKYQGNYDEELIAVYRPTAVEDSVEIVKGWRANAKKGKIEGVAIDKTQYRPSEEHDMIYNNQNLSARGRQPAQEEKK